MVLTKKERNRRYYIKHTEACNLRGKCDYIKNKLAYKIRAAKSRGLGFEILIPNSYEHTNIRWEWHHIDDKHVVAVPYSVHHAAQTNHINKVNDWIETCYGINIKEIKECDEHSFC